MRCFRALLAALLCCRCASDEPYTPDEVQVHAGQQWFNTEESSWQGPAVGVSVGWALGARRKMYEDLRAIREQSAEASNFLDHLNQKESAVLASLEIQDPVIPAAPAPVPVSSDPVGGILDRLFDMSPGALGIPNGIWTGIVVLLFVVGVAVAKRYGVLRHVPFLRGKGSSKKP